jgi:CRISPR-associated protein Cas2
MSRSRHRYIVAYDIRDDKRLRRVAAIMRGFGWRMQYSVFIADLDLMELLALQYELSVAIKHDADSIAFIEVGAPGDLGRDSFEFMGRKPLLPTGGSLVI